MAPVLSMAFSAFQGVNSTLWILNEALPMSEEPIDRQKCWVIRRSFSDTELLKHYPKDFLNIPSLASPCDLG